MTVASQTIDLIPEQQHSLLQLARQSIHYGLSERAGMALNLDDYPACFAINTATFVTLHKRHALRGCIGSLRAYRPLVEDIVAHARAAAFEDYRFPPVNHSELQQLTIEISILTPPELITQRCEAELLSQLQAGRDGLILTSGHHKATFLPSVWQQLPNKQEFLLHLKRKAGLADNDWPSDMSAQRYSTIRFSEADSVSPT